MNDAWETAREIECLLREAGLIAKDYHKDTAIRRQVNQKNARARLLGERLAEQFASLHGWKLAHRPFSLDQLAENRKARNWRKGEYFEGGLHLDHPCWYRLNGFPIAIAVQNYDLPNHRGELDRECGKRGLVWEQVTDFPSWHSPGAAQLILITRPRPRGE